MKKIVQNFLKNAPVTVQAHSKGLPTNPMAPWKRNTFGILIGLTMGTYIGQYFPDIYF
jgi:hypothetical protein